jgi:2',3'-cyclic-nucleotide 2'-phosphodiesterase (5'-nucleotidase family)
VGGTAFDLPNTPFQETALGDLVTDSYLAAANALPGPPAAIAIEASGNIRVPLLKGKTGRLAFSDVFNVVPLGLGPDKKPGYPLAAVYLTAKDIVSGLTLSTIAADPNSAALGIHDNDYFLQISGATYETNPNAPLFGHLQHAEIGNTVIFDRATMPPDDTKCYRVVMTYYVASLLGLLETATGGALTATPKQADCATPYTPATLPTAILDAGGGAEIKQWQALVKYIARSPMLPASYAEPANRIIMTP